MQDTLTTNRINIAPMQPARTIVSATWAHGLASISPGKLQNILLPFDLSRASVFALRLVADLVEKTGAAIHLIHALPEPHSNDLHGTTGQIHSIIEAPTERVIKHWVKRVLKERVKTTVTLRRGDPVEVILASAVACSADLIVMTSHSFSSHSLELHRSNAEKVSRQAPCAVLTIPEKRLNQVVYKEPLECSWRKIMIPIDFSRLSEQAVIVAARIAQETNARLILAHGDQHRLSEEIELHSQVKRWASNLLDEPLTWEVAIWPGGRSLYAILSEAIRSEVDLIVLPTVADSWARRLRAGSITDGVLRQASCPVLAINENISRE